MADETADAVQIHYELYRKVLTLGKEPALEKGKVMLRAVSDDTLVFVRNHGNDTYVVAVNMGDKMEEINLKKLFKEFMPFIEVVVSSVNSSFTVG